MRGLIAICALITCLLPVAAAADKVAILPVSYARADGGEVSSQTMKKIEDEVAKGAQEAGFEVVGVERRSCEDSDCLARVASDLGADEAVAVGVVVEDETSYSLKIVYAYREKVTAERTAGFFVVLEWLRGSVALSLQKAVAAHPAVEEPVVEESVVEEPVVEEPGGEEPGGEEPGGEEPVDDEGGVSPAAMYVSAGVTGALLIAWGITDIVVHGKYKDLEESDADREKWLDDRESARSLQTADRVLLGFAAAGLVTTAVLFFVVDFDDKDDAPVEVTGFGPAPTDGGGGLLLRGRF
jgi:hypothetical protein